MVVGPAVSFWSGREPRSVPFGDPNCDWIHSAFSIGRHQMAYVAAAVLSGGNVRVGLEDNLWLEKGHLATNAELVARAVTIVEAMGVQVMTPEEVRAELQLTKRALP